MLEIQTDRKMSEETVKFRVLCVMFESMLRTKTSAKKRSKFRKFLDQIYNSREYFSAVRLILPSLDRERGTYGLKESTLATCLIDALGISKDSEDAVRLVNWRKGGTKTGANAGNFALVAAEVLQRRQGMASGGLTIKEINDALDLLALKENRTDKASVLSDLIKKTNVLEMKWIVMIVLKDLKLGVSEKSIFHEFHPDAEDLFNVTCDLKLVCEKLKDRTQRHKRQDIEVGKAVRPQLALRVSDAPTAWKKLHGKQVVVECKFDGDRIQIHKNGAKIHFFSRSFLDHSEYEHAMANVINQNILVDRCILDGEMLVWDTSTQRFAEFGSNQEIAKAAREGLESHRQLCYIAFDVLYVGDTSVIHQSLKERHDLLRKVVKPLKGRLEILVPDGGLNAHRPSGEPCWSLVAYNMEEVERFFKETIENRDEGIVLKDLSSKWEPSDRSGKWLKLKPDYIHAGSDLDVLIIGGYFGSGRRGGEVAQFLVGLAECSTSSTYPKRFISFCRVGTGLSDEELDAVVTKLKPYFRKNEYPKRTPSFYEVTNNSKERPDVWVESPEKSIIVSITSDIRTISSEVFAAPYSLRFPRIHRVRYDKPWHDCLDVQSFVNMVQASNGNTQRGMDYGGFQDLKSKRVKSSIKGENKTISVVPAHFIQTDISGVQEATLIFSNMMFYFVNVPPSYSVDSFHKMVAENGGAFSMNLNDSVTHYIAAERKGIKYQAAKLRGDIIHYSWILDCCSQKHLLHLQPKYFLSLSDSSKKKLQGEIDAFSDYYFWDLDVMDIKQMFGNMEKLEDPENLNDYKKKYCQMEKWCLFQDCCISFFASPCPMNTDPKDLSELALTRIALEISMHGGEVSNDLSCATHLAVFSPMEFDVDFDKFSESFPPEQRHILRSKKLHVVRHQWLEDSLERGKKLQEDAYSLRPKSSELDTKESEQEVEVPVAVDSVEQERFSASPDRKEKGKRGRLIHSNTRRGRRAVGETHRTRAKLESRPAKIDRNESENSDSSDAGERKEETELKIGNTKRGANAGQTQRTRVNLGSRAPKIKPNESENGASSDEPERREVTEVKKGNTKRGANVGQTRRTRAKQGRPAKLNPNESEVGASSDEAGTRKGIGTTEEENKTKNSVTVNDADEIKAYKGKEILDYRGQQGSDTVGKIEMDKKESAPEGAKVKGFENICGIQEEEKAGTTGKLEQMIDPVQAMLLDMIPSLGLQKAETQKTVFEDEKPQSDLSENRTKKKVSYKDVAGLLLKDW